MLIAKSAAKAGARPTPTDHHRPEVFLYPAWRGDGVTCDAFGIQGDKYTVSGGGRLDADGQVVIDYRVAFDNGLVNVHAWKIKPDTGALIVARDLITGAEARGRVTESGFYWATHARMKTAFGVRRCRVELAYDIRGEHDVTSTVTIAFLGVTVATASAHIRHLDAAHEPLKRTG